MPGSANPMLASRWVIAAWALRSAALSSVIGHILSEAVEVPPLPLTTVANCGHGDATDQQLQSSDADRLARRPLRRLDGWADALFELCDAMLCAPGPASSIPHLSLEPAFRRSHSQPVQGAGPRADRRRAAAPGPRGASAEGVAGGIRRRLSRCVQGQPWRENPASSPLAPGAGPIWEMRGGGVQVQQVTVVSLAGEPPVISSAIEGARVERLSEPPDLVSSRAASRIPSTSR